MERGKEGGSDHREFKVGKKVVADTERGSRERQPYLRKRTVEPGRVNKAELDT